MQQPNPTRCLSLSVGRTAPVLTLLAFLALSWAGPAVARAADYAINWWTIDGGGGQSTGGVYTVTGTIAQPDAGRMSGGDFTVGGGFWGIVAAVQTPQGPTLSVTRTDTNTVVVSWPAPAEGWLLQAATSLVSGTNCWTEIHPPYQTQGLTNISFTEVWPLGNKFYRLHKP